MKKLLGGPGTITGLLLRVGQCLCAAASIGVMVSSLGFSNYTAFCYLIASMGLQVSWSLGLAGLDFYALKIRRNLQSPVLISLFVVGDWVTATLSLAAACCSAGVTILYIRDTDYCRSQPNLDCHRYQISIALGFITWLLIYTSSLVMLWLLASI
ncbi:CASP-like protein 5B2 [Aristolochia californica]|uniref:CASP-like protein 5B2 n=1 Tax=Aristolochia californica TaxID=171875 RepID=UPI0035D9738F